MAIRVDRLSAASSAGFLAGSFLWAGAALATPADAEQTVRLFLGLQANSPVRAASITSDADGVIVKGLDAPLGAQPDAPHLKVESLIFSSITSEGTTATFGSIVGGGLTISGAAEVTARTVLLSDVRARDLGSRPLSVASLDNLMMTGVALANMARMDSYAVSFSGPLTGVFSGALHIDGLQSAALAAAGLNDRFDLKLDYHGDGTARSFAASYSLSQPLLGVLQGTANWSDVDFKVADATPIAQFDLGSVIQTGALHDATVTLVPGPNARMLIKAMNPQQRQDAVATARRFLERDGSLSSERIGAVTAEIQRFLDRPERLTASITPPTPVVLGTLSVKSDPLGSLDRRFGFAVSTEADHQAGTSATR